MYKQNILCAIDFSESSLEALKWSLNMAQECQAQLTILFCYRLIAAEDEKEMINLKRNMEDEAIRKFREFERKYIPTQVVSYKFVTEVGFFPVRIEMFVRDGSANLLVLGSSMVANFNEYKNPSFEQFLVKSTLPVVIVPCQSTINTHIKFN